MRLRKAGFRILCVSLIACLGIGDIVRSKLEYDVTFVQCDGSFEINLIATLRVVIKSSVHRCTYNSSVEQQDVVFIYWS